jgi:energy-coupling factor transport system permease protein
LWALGLAAAASRTTNPVPLLLIIAVTWFVVSARRGDTPWAASYALFFKLSLAVIAIHLVFQALLADHGQGLTVLVTLPEIPLPDATGVKLGGEITLEALLTALYFALQLAAIFCCIGAANALGSSRQLLRYMPAALYEIGVACVIALTFAPQLVTDARRVRLAAHSRARGRGKWRRFGRLVMPVLEGSLERSVELAAAMDARGYGRTTVADPTSRRITATLLVTGSLATSLGLYGVLGSSNAWLGLPVLALGVAVVCAGFVVGGRRTGRTRYRPDPWAAPELLVVSCGVAAAVLTFWQARHSPQLLILPSITEIPPVPLLTCLGLAIALLPAVLAPPLPRSHSVMAGRAR